VRDVRGREPSEVRDRITVRDLSSLPVGFADLELGLVDSAGAFVPFPGRQFGYNVAALAVRSSLVDRRPGVWPRVHRYRWRVVDESGNRIATGDTAVTSPRALVPAVLRPALPPLFLGEYSFELELQEGRDTWRTSRVFEVEESGPPQGRDFDLLCEALLYIAEASEVDALRLLPASDRGAGWDAFWRRRDPTPETARNEYQIEFFRRLHVAEQRFQGFGPGWRSDMGRIYIRYGPPDQVEQRAGTSTQPALEIWYYNQPYRRLVFADREGFGRYVLMNSPGE
jgi:GWxTD domain-containing protein